MSRKRNVKNLKLDDFKGDPHAARNSFYYEAPATRIAKAQSEKYRIKKK